MKSGVIIYVAGNAPENWTEDDEVDLRNSEPQANLVEIITTNTGHFDVLDAWWDLISRGMSLIICKMAVFDNTGRIEMTDKQLRLCG